MLKRSLVKRAMDDSISLENDAVVEELAASSTPAEELVESVETELAETAHEQSSNEEAYSETVEEVASLESCISGMRTILSMESAAEGMVEAGATEEEAAASVIDNVVEAVESVEPGMSESEDIAMESEAPGAARRFWDRVKAMFAKLKDAVVSFFKSIMTRLVRFWDNISQSNQRVLKSALGLKAALQKLKGWNESATIQARSSWVVKGSVDPRAIADAVNNQVNVSRGLGKHFKTEVSALSAMADKIKSMSAQALVTTGDAKESVESLSAKVAKTLGFGAKPKNPEDEFTSLLGYFVGFQVNAETGEITTAKLSGLTSISVGKRAVVESILNNVIKLMNAGDTETKSMREDMKKAQVSVDAAVKAAEQSLAKMDQSTDEDAHAAATVRLAQLRLLRSQVADILRSLKWYFKGLPLRSCNNALGFVSACTRAAGSEK